MKTIRLLLLLLIIGIIVFLLLNTLPLYKGLVLIVSSLTLLWLYSLYLKDASIIDSFWGTGFAISAWFYYYLLGQENLRAIVLCTLVTIWGVRLSLHIGIRNYGKGEDYRYQEWRKEYGKNFWWISYGRVYLLQGFLLWIIASPLLVAQTLVNQSLQWLDYVGIVIWLAGFLFEAVGDWQLTQFKKKTSAQGKTSHESVMDKGLWKYTRHPNYFGDSLLWWGYFLFACSAGGYWYFFSPLLMTYMLLEVSGVALLEKKLAETKPQYKEYIRKTSSFFPMPPKK